MERKYIVLGGIAAVMLIIGLLAINSIIGDEDAVVKKRPNFNISEVSHKVAVEKPETAILEQAAADISQKTTSEVTVYNQEFALIKDSREMELEKGVNLVEFKDIASKIDSTSVTFRDLSFPSTFVVEQNYEYDLVSTQKLLEKYLDKEITVQADEGESAKEYSGKLLSFKDGIVLQTAQGVVILPIYSKVQFPSLPGGLLTKPTLVWKVYSEDAGKRDTQTIYLTAGMGWKADYIAIVDGEDKQISLSGWTTITNNSGTSYPDAKLKLVAGDVHKVNESPKYEEAYDYAVRSTAAGAAPPQFGTQALFEYYLYTLERNTDILNNETKQISLLSSEAIPVKKEYVFEPSKGGYYYGGGNSGTKVEVRVNFKNSKSTGLGMPLPKGKIRVYKQDSDGQLQFVGEDEIDHTKEDADVDLFLGNAFDITGERVQLERQEISKGISREQYKVTLENAKDTAVQVKVKDYFYGSWTISQSSLPIEKKSSTQAQYIVNVPAKGKAEATYTVEYRYYY
ncbi:MAG TPA: DUF4139 domain-containing protein [Candidatus Diapherotrites archaeon]|uniref:DUF4139 domain-containing protein n=1 Tax=Candidatus Iainarchaeum sp. TaxID=3101447 RepID=A0A7J4IZR7_9ARCH|nr:DUF4139 domain-containing protein [Candidatus Diapherotrites archaeon]